MISFDEAYSFVHSKERQKSVYDMDGIRALCENIGNIQEKLKIVHIAGTNGKGSVGAFLQSILTRAGYKVGRYASPAVFSPLEIFTINGESMSEDEYAVYAEKIMNMRFPVREPTAFEIETAIAFMWFYDKGCDIALVESGLGGRDDATNIINSKELCVFTSIGMDHMGILGATIEEIAENKAGILRPATAAVSATQTDSVREILQKAKSISFTDGIIPHGSGFDYKEFTGLTPSLKGDYQMINAAVAVEAALALRERGFEISSDAVYEGIANAVWRGRFEILREEPLFVTDGAHNIDGILALDKALLPYYGKELYAVCGVFADKEYEKMMAHIAPRFKYIYAVSAPAPRGLSAKELEKTVKKFNKNTEASTLDFAIGEIVKNDRPAVVFGTLSILKDAQSIFYGETRNGKN